MKNLFYGWRVVGAGGALQFLQSVLLNSAFGVYVAVLVEERGWSKTALSGAAALKSTEVALLGPILGWMVDRFGAKGPVRIGVILFGIGFMLLSRIDSLLEFYAAFVVIALGSSMFSNLLVSVAIIQWFEKHRTRALSALQFGGAIGGLFVFLVAWSIQTFGWRPTAMGSGILAILVGFPLASVIRSRPADMGLTVDGLPPAEKIEGKAEAPAGPAFTARQALRTSAFWLLSLGHGFSLLVVMAINVHAVTHMKEGLGYTLAQASLFFILVTLGQFFGVMLGWLVGEKFAKRNVAATCMLMHAVGMLLLTFAPGPFILAFGLLLHGVGWGLRGPFMQAIRADYFGRRSLGVILGLSTMITVIGHIFGPLMAGAFADWQGNYIAGFSVLAALAAVGSLFFYMAKPPPVPQAAMAQNR
jgi:sugar phosphate permease